MKGVDNIRLPKLTQQPTYKNITEEFGGYNNNLRITEGEWISQENMTGDFYPAASSRGKRSVQQISESAVIPAENSQIADKSAAIRGLCYFNNKLFSLQPISSGTNSTGHWLFEANEPICCDENTPLSLDKCAYFDKDNTSFRDCFHMGSYLCTFPDGVVYETANTEENIPVHKVEEQNTAQVLDIRTVVKSDGADEYTPIEVGNSYRVQDAQVQYYIENESMWVNQNTYVMIFAKNTNTTFAPFNEGDTVSVKYSSVVNNDMYTRAASKSGIFGEKKKEASLKIIKKGTIASNSSLGISSATDYIIASGHVHIFNSYQNSELGAHHLYGSFNNAVIKRKCPDIRFACESQNRIWACSKDGHEIYASALGDPYNFYDYSGIATDSYGVNVGTYGDFTACLNYLGRPHFFKENALHIINGSYPSNAGELDGMSFSVTTVDNFRGVEKGSERSLAVIDNILYYKSSAGIVAFDGTNTVVVSDALGKEKYKNAAAGAYNNKYYVSMQDGAGNHHLFVYDTSLGIWSREDDTNAVQFINAGNELLFLNSDDNKVCSVCSEDVLENEEFETEGEVKWMCETGNIGYSYPNNKYLSRIQLRMQMSEGAQAVFYIQYDSDGVWHRRGEMSTKGIKTHLIPIVPVRCDHMKIKIEGKGDVKIISLAKILEEGGDV